MYVIVSFSNYQIFKLKSMNKFTAYVRDSYRELLQKVTWPTFDNLTQSTMIVLGATLLITGMVWVMDLAANSLLKFIYSLFKG